MKGIKIRKYSKGSHGRPSYDIAIEPWRSGSVNVSPHEKIMTGELTQYEINWSAWGATSILRTKQFIKALQMAVKLAEKETSKEITQ